MVTDIAADIAAVQRIDAVPRILEIVCGNGIRRGGTGHRKTLGLLRSSR